MIDLVRGVALHDGHGAAWHVQCIMVLHRPHALSSETEGETLPRKETDCDDGPCEQVRAVKVLAKLAAALIVDVQDRRVDPSILEDAAVNKNRCEAGLPSVVNPVWDVVSSLRVEGLGAFTLRTHYAWR